MTIHTNTSNICIIILSIFNITYYKCQFNFEKAFLSTIDYNNHFIQKNNWFNKKNNKNVYYDFIFLKITNTIMIKKLWIITLASLIWITIAGCSINKDNQTTQKTQAIKIYTPEEAYKDFWKWEIKNIIDITKKALSYKYYEEKDKIEVNWFVTSTEQQNNINFAFLLDTTTKWDNENIKFETIWKLLWQLEILWKNDLQKYNLEIPEFKIRLIDNKLYIKYKNINLQINWEEETLNQIKYIIDNLNKFSNKRLEQDLTAYNYNTTSNKVSTTQLLDAVNKIYNALSNYPIFTATKEEKINNWKKYYIELDSNNIKKIIEELNNIEILNLQINPEEIDQIVKTFNENYKWEFISTNMGYQFIFTNPTTNEVIEFGKQNTREYISFKMKEWAAFQLIFENGQIIINSTIWNGEINISDNNWTIKFNLLFNVNTFIMENQLNINLKISSEYKKLNEVNIEIPSKTIPLENIFNAAIQPSPANIPNTEK